MSALLHCLLEGRQRSVQMDAHGRLGTLEHLGDLVGRQVLLDPEQYGGPLTRRQPVHLAHAPAEPLVRWLPSAPVPSSFPLPPPPPRPQPSPSGRTSRRSSRRSCRRSRRSSRRSRTSFRSCLISRPFWAPAAPQLKA